jgi:hypothetical protein
MDFQKYILKGTLFIFTTLLISSCVQKTKKQKVEFFVDVRDIENVNSIGVRGSTPPLNWNQNFELKDDNNDSIYTGTIIFEIPYDFVELKLVKNEDQFELNNQPNRKLLFDKSGDTKYQVKFDKKE